jgi:putative restriction endonuclease
VQNEWLSRVQRLRRWEHSGQRAPHKPLLLLYALGRLQRGETGPVLFTELEAPVRNLLRDFGPARRSYHPEFPFHHLTSDGLWQISDQAGRDARTLGTAVTRLRAAGARGQLESAFEQVLDADPVLLAAVVRALLDGNFPASLHDDLLVAVGLDIDGLEAGPAAVPGQRGPARQRDRAFRDLVLMAYEYRCAMCGFEGWLDGTVVGLEAAHVRWWMIGGPDTVDNALALCTLHHRLLDRGVLGLAEDATVLVSQLFASRAPAAHRQVLDLAGQPIARPQAGHPMVADLHRSWHAAQVFRGPARLAS